MLNKKHFLYIISIILCVVLSACGSSVRTSNVKKVLESRVQSEEAESVIEEKEEIEEIVPPAQASSIVVNPSSMEVPKETLPSVKVDLDLTNLNSIVADANLRTLQDNKEKYRGLIVKAKGEYQYYKDPDTGNEYYNCIFASSCCPNGLEFVLTDKSRYPKNDGEIITVVGAFNYYEENGITYYNLINASIV